MFSTTIKQSVATLGVVAGLLAAAGPASAQILDGPILAKAGPQPEAGGYLATDPSSEVDNQIRLSIGGGTQVGSEGVGDDVPLETVSFRGELIGLEPTVKAPANAMSADVSGQEMAEAVKAPASPTSEVFTSVSNVAPLHGDATTIGVWHEAARSGLAHVEVVMGMSEEFLKAPRLGAANDVSQLSLAQQGTQVGSEGGKAPTKMCTEGNNQPGCGQYIEIQ